MMTGSILINCLACAEHESYSYDKQSEDKNLNERETCSHLKKMLDRPTNKPQAKTVHPQEEDNGPIEHQDKYYTQRIQEGFSDAEEGENGGDLKQEIISEALLANNSK